MQNSTDRVQVRVCKKDVLNIVSPFSCKFKIILHLTRSTYGRLNGHARYRVIFTFATLFHYYDNI